MKARLVMWHRQAQNDSGHRLAVVAEGRRWLHVVTLDHLTPRKVPRTEARYMRTIAELSAVRSFRRLVAERSESDRAVKIVNAALAEAQPRRLERT